MVVHVVFLVSVWIQHRLTRARNQSMVAMLAIILVPFSCILLSLHPKKKKGTWSLCCIGNGRTPHDYHRRNQQHRLYI